ncbi:MAG: hypothetical protein V3V01_10780 [Acidimicrobiales bacterium]
MTAKKKAEVPMHDNAIGVFGPDVIGEEESKRQKKIVKEKRMVFGPLVLDHPGSHTASKKTPAELAAENKAAGTLSIKDITKHLKENPAMAEEFFRTELKRPDKRSGALAAILASAASDQLRTEIRAEIKKLKR